MTPVILAILVSVGAKDIQPSTFNNSKLIPNRALTSLDLSPKRRAVLIAADLASRQDRLDQYTRSVLGDPSKRPPPPKRRGGKYTKDFSNPARRPASVDIYDHYWIDTKTLRMKRARAKAAARKRRMKTR